MNDDTLCLRWIASHLVSFHYGLFYIIVVWIDDDGVHHSDEIRIPDDNIELEDVELLRFAVKSIREKN